MYHNIQLCECNCSTSFQVKLCNSILLYSVGTVTLTMEFIKNKSSYFSEAYKQQLSKYITSNSMALPSNCNGGKDAFQIEVIMTKTGTQRTQETNAELVHCGTQNQTDIESHCIGGTCKFTPSSSRTFSTSTYLRHTQNTYRSTQ